MKWNLAILFAILPAYPPTCIDDGSRFGGLRRKGRMPETDEGGFFLSVSISPYYRRLSCLHRQNHEELGVYRVSLEFAAWSYSKMTSSAGQVREEVYGYGAVDYENEHRFAEHEHDKEGVYELTPQAHLHR